VARWHRVPLSALRADGRAVVVADGREIALFRVDGDVHALENACPHAGNPLVEGQIADRTLTCAYHLWRFDLETGACVSGEVPARRYPAEIRAGEIWIDVG
jgi:nitrite reductase/ring-hydroxylating ferredoxin subunit